jgi:CRP-like cAMP-binding protein
MHLKDIELFKDLSAVEQSRLIGCMEKLEVLDGEIIFNHGDIGDSLFIIILGKVELFTIDEYGREHFLTYLGEGEAFGEMALLTGEPKLLGIVLYIRCAAMHLINIYLKILRLLYI